MTVNVTWPTIALNYATISRSRNLSVVDAMRYCNFVFAFHSNNARKLCVQFSFSSSHSSSINSASQSTLWYNFLSVHTLAWCDFAVENLSFVKILDQFIKLEKFQTRFSACEILVLGDRKKKKQTKKKSVVASFKASLWDCSFEIFPIDEPNNWWLCMICAYWNVKH